ncbi:hypothetical protein AB1046_04275 [Promicromonospora sp. Populi]|uniref:hypothetical protein n=1 Tax=Promicromonospora sp. Populi TaxID=3239420 RepID=UPI0034E22E20
MRNSVEVPRRDDLAGFPVEVVPGDEPGVCSVTAWAGDGDEATVTWDERAASVQVRWQSDKIVRLETTREALSKVSVRDIGESVEFHVWLRTDGLGGELVVEIGQNVSVRDTLLRM